MKYKRDDCICNTLEKFQKYFMQIRALQATSMQIRAPEVLAKGGGGALEKNGKILVLRKRVLKLKFLVMKDVIEYDQICTPKGTIRLVVATATQKCQDHK